jgi:8-oxo-dGTP diphosphatase
MAAPRSRPSRIPVGPDGRPRHALTADAIVFRGQSVLLVGRANPPHRGFLALPGGFVEGHESAEAAALRELSEETGLSGRIVGLVGLYSRPGRDPRGPTATAAYLIEATGGKLLAGDDAASARFVPIARATRQRLAFDHNEVLADGLLFREALGPLLSRVPARSPRALRKS